MKRDTLVIATRGSRLALVQAHWVATQVGRLAPGVDVQLSVIKTQGDKILDVPLAQVGGKGLFVKEIEDALLDGRAQIAVHSMKDVPSELPPGLVLAAISKREDPRDVLVSRGGLEFKELPSRARVGTSSLRRKAQILAQRPDFRIESIRGNVETRLKKLQELELDAVILAAAGLNRLGISEETAQLLPPEILLPAVGQGALGIETREDDKFTRSLVAKINHPETAHCVAAERAFLARLEGGCQVPIAGFAEERNGIIRFRGLVAEENGGRVIHGDGLSDPGGAAGLGVRVAEEILERGGREILAQVYGEAPA